MSTITIQLLTVFALLAGPVFAEHGGSGSSSSGGGSVNTLLSGRGAAAGGGGGGGGGKAREAAEYGFKTLMPKVLEDNKKSLDEYSKNVKSSTDQFNAGVKEVNKITDEKETAQNMKQLAELTNSLSTAGVDKNSEDTFTKITKAFDDLSTLQEKSLKATRDGFVSQIAPAAPVAQGPSKMDRLFNASSSGGGNPFANVLNARSEKADRIPELRNGAVDALSNSSGQHGGAVARGIKSLKLQSAQKSYNSPMDP